MWFPDPEKHPELYRDAVAQWVEKQLIQRGMEDELLLHAAGFEPESIAGVGEVWITPGCGCIRDRASALLQTRIMVGRGEVEYPLEWSEPPDYPPELEDEGDAR